MQVNGFREKLDLSRLNGVKIVEINGKQYVQIPVEDNPLYVSDKTNGAYLDLVVTSYFTPKYGATHYIKPSINREDYLKMSQAQRKNIPIVGTLMPLGTPVNQQIQENQNKIITINDLPF